MADAPPRIGGVMSTATGSRRTSRRQTEKLVAKYDRIMMRSGHALVDRFGEGTAEVMRREVLDEFRRLLPEVPYIGGRRNLLSGTLVESAVLLALYRAVVEHGGTVEDAGEVIHRMVRAETERRPRLMRSLMKRLRFGRMGIRRFERLARRSQARRYPGDWVFEVVPSDGATFDAGVDYTECGIVTFLHAQGADELTPYICDCDYITAEVMGFGLRRTKTLAWGCDRCDFRYSKRAVTPAPWPPAFVERTCGEPERTAQEPASQS